MVRIELRKIRKVGDSLDVSLPVKYSKYLGIEQGDYVVVELQQDGIRITKVRKVEE